MIGFSIEILGRGEEVQYVEEGRTYVFDVSFAEVPHRLFVGDYWDPVRSERCTVSEEQRYIVGRLAEWLSRGGRPTVVDWTIDASRRLPPKITARAEWVDPRQSTR